MINLLFNPAMLGVLAIFLSVIWMLRDQKDRTRPLLVLALVLNLFYGVLLNFTMGRESGLLPWKYDHILFRMDESLGLQVPAAMVRSLQGDWRIFLWIVYQAMVPMMIVWFLVTEYGGRRGSVVLAYVTELIFGPLLYAVVPGCGPIYAFGKQWLNPAAVAADTMRLTGMPNAFPSLHVATAFVFVFFAPGRLWRAIALAFLAATLLATLSTGEHYVIDLVPGLAFGCCASYVGLRRVRSALGFLGMVLAWSLSVRLAYPFLIAHPGVELGAIALTVAVVILGLIRGWEAAERERTMVQEAPALANSN
jgi:PAP2 superfamily